MATKYVIFGYNFDRNMRGWIKPEIVDGCDKADVRIYELWEDYQNEFVIGGWDDDDEGYMQYNFCEEDGAGSVAWSRIRGHEGSLVLVAKPISGANFGVLHACESETGCGVNLMAYKRTERDALQSVIEDVYFERSLNMECPQVVIQGDDMTVYDSMGFDEHYYQIVDVR